MGYLYHVYDVIGDIIKKESAVRTRPRMFYLGTMDGIKGRSTAKDFLSSFLLLFGLSEKQLQCLTIFNILSWSVNFFHLLCDLPWTKPPIDFVYSSRTLLLRYTSNLYGISQLRYARWVLPFNTLHYPSLLLQVNISLIFRGIRTSLHFFHSNQYRIIALNYGVRLITLHHSGCYRVIPSDSCGVNNEVQWRTCNNSDKARSPVRYFCREVKVRQAEGTTLRILADGVTTTTASYHAVYPVVFTYDRAPSHTSARQWSVCHVSKHICSHQVCNAYM